jgi:hypothetical protein
VESKIKADVAASKQQAAARRAARQRAFQEAMASSLTFPQLRSSVEQPPLGGGSSGGAAAAALAAVGAGGAGTAAGGGSSGSASGPVSIAERFLSNPLSAWFLGEGPPPGAAPGVTTHHELMWQQEVAWGTPGGAGPPGDMLGPGSDVSESEVSTWGQLRDTWVVACVGEGVTVWLGAAGCGTLLLLHAGGMSPNTGFNSSSTNSSSRQLHVQEATAGVPTHSNKRCSMASKGLPQCPATVLSTSTGGHSVMQQPGQPVRALLVHALQANQAHSQHRSAGTSLAAHVHPHVTRPCVFWCRWLTGARGRVP